MFGNRGDDLQGLEVVLLILSGFLSELFVRPFVRLIVFMVYTPFIRVVFTPITCYVVGTIDHRFRGCVLFWGFFGPFVVSSVWVLALAFRIV